MSEIVENAPLPRARRALAQARRQLDDLEQAREDIEKYRDLLPYVLDRLLNVWRVIDTESRGRRPQAFSTWWLNQKDGNRSSVARLRNQELKANQQSAKQEKFFRGENSIRVLENGKVEAVRPDGTISPLLPDGTVDAGEMVWQKTPMGIHSSRVGGAGSKGGARTRLHEIENRGVARGGAASGQIAERDRVARVTRYCIPANPAPPCSPPERRRAARAVPCCRPDCTAMTG